VADAALDDLTLGIDLAAQPAGTAACLVRWSQTTAEALTLARDLDDDALTRLRHGVGVVAIDAPFAWPEGLSAALAMWSAERRWPEVTPQQLRYRVTDLEVQRQTGIWPLSASADRIGVCAWRCAALLSAWGVSDLAGGDGVIEAYPAAALRCWGLPFRGYKARSAPAAARSARARAEIIAALRRRCLWLQLAPAQWTACQDSHDLLDALICALISRAAHVGAVTAPAAGQARAAEREGWIPLPTADSLELLDPSRRSRS
jgi:predicted nuclease with RNAse H fold